MKDQERFFIIKEDGNALMVNKNQLKVMQDKKLLSPDDHIVPAPPLTDEEKALPGEPAEEDVDTEPLKLLPLPPAIPNKAKAGDVIEDADIEQAFSQAFSDGFFQLDVEHAAENIVTSQQEVDKEFSPHEQALGFCVRWDDGRVLGPFSEEEVLRRIQSKGFLGQEEISLPGEVEFQSIRNYPPFHRKFLLKEVSQHSQLDEKPFQGENWPGLLLGIKKEGFTGFLFVREEERVFLLTFERGRIKNIADTHPHQASIDDLLTNLFLSEGGTYWKSADALATRDKWALEKSTVEICRNYTSPQLGYPFSRIVKFIGEQNRLIGRNDSHNWCLSKNELSLEENALVREIEKSQKITSLVEIALKGLFKSKTEVFHHLFLLIQAGVLSIQSESPQEKLLSIEKAFFSDSFPSLFSIDIEASEEDVIRGVLLFRNYLEDYLEELPEADALKARFEKRLKEIETIFKDPLKRFTYLKAYQQGESLTHNLLLKERLEVEYLTSHIIEALKKDQKPVITPLAKQLFELRPKEKSAYSSLLLARLMETEEPIEKQQQYALLKNTCRRDKNTPFTVYVGIKAALMMGEEGWAHKLAKHGQQFHHSMFDEFAELIKSKPKRLDGSEGLVRVFWALGLTAFVTGLLWLLGADLELGHRELQGPQWSLFSLTRTVMLLIVSFAGIGVLHGSIGQYTRRLPLKASSLWLIASFVLGWVAALFFPSLDLFHFEAGSRLSAWLLFVLLVTAERYYFSGFAGEEIRKYFQSRWLATFWVAFLYSVYSLSYVSLFQGGEIYTNGLVVLIFLSLPMALLQIMCANVSLPFLYQFAFVTGVFVTRSLS